MEPVRIGVVGCGNISDAYFKGMGAFPGLDVQACADLDPEAARLKAELYGLRALSVDALLADPAIEVVVNLTVPAAHADVSGAIVGAGKHAYSEKPLAITAGAARALMSRAAAKGVRVGCAPDTFLGAAPQAARSLIDRGAIGKPLSGALCVMSRGMEHWHPNPSFFFKPGGGPLLDLGPYYITTLVHLLGPVARATAVSAIGYPVRRVSSKPRAGEEITVEVPTTVHGVLETEAGAVVTLSASWDVWRHERAPIEIYGTEGSMLVPDPNFFAGLLKVSERDGEWREVDHAEVPFGAANYRTNSGNMVANYRAVGVADFAAALREERPARVSGELALHVLEVLEALERSAIEGRHIAVAHRVERPAPLDGVDFGYAPDGRSR